MEAFTVYVTSVGSSDLFQSNTISTFSNRLMTPIENASLYEVKLISCALNPAPATPVLVYCNIMKAPMFDSGKLPVLGIFDPKSGSVQSTYVTITANALSTIRCSIVDIKQNFLPDYTFGILGLHFRPMRTFPKPPQFPSFE